MDYGSIIKRSWRITWQYKGLWVLGLFAGVSGCQASGSGGGNSWNTGAGSDASSSGILSNAPDVGRFTDLLQQWLPMILVATAALVMIWFVWAVLSIAARGGLVTGVNAIEDGHPATLGALWSAGFSRFWSLFVLEVLLGLPVFVVLVGMLAGVAVPLIRMAAGGGDFRVEGFIPICGSVGLGLPLLIVLSFILGNMRLISLRYVMLGGQGAFTAAGNSWRFFRARFKDTFLMWLINAGLNFAASMVIAIPAVVIGIVVAVPVIAGAATGKWEALVPVIAVGVLVLMVLSFFYSAVWGAYTSALWTLFFRKVAGMERPAEAVAEPVDPTFYPTQPAPPATDFAPPMADYSVPSETLPAPPAPPIGEYPTNPPEPPAPGD